MSRLGSGVRRAGSAGAENKHLRETIAKLQQDLLRSEAQAQKVTDHLNCLILLVKRAWTGDKSAAVHVANIVGIAPPDITEEVTNGLKVTLTAKPKSRALNNWALLTIGLLNHMYHQMEQDLEEKQHRHLQQRIDFLEDQIVLHRDVKFRQNYKPSNRAQPGDFSGESEKISGSQSCHSLGAYQSPGPVLNTSVSNGHMPPSRIRHQSWTKDSPKTFVIQSTHQGPQNGHQDNDKMMGDHLPPGGTLSSQRRPSAKHLYRQASKDTSEDRMKWSDLFVEAASNSASDSNTNKVMTGLYKLGHLPRNRFDSADEFDQNLDDVDDEDRTMVSYDDPTKYTTSGLFDPDETIVPDEVRRNKRPVSAIQQRTSDTIRSRPKSGVSQKGDRPLKYETTRPISAPLKHKQEQKQVIAEKNNNRNRAKSAPPRRLNRASSRENLLKPSPSVASVSSLHKDIPNTNRGSGEERDGKQLSEEDPIWVKIRTPQCVNRFVGDLEAMKQMEDDFKRQTLALQKQLGISPDGMLH